MKMESGLINSRVNVVTVSDFVKTNWWSEQSNVNIIAKKSKEWSHQMSSAGCKRVISEILGETEFSIGNK